jgi:hypothetical protein
LNSLGTEHHPDYETAKNKGLIESGIIPLTDALFDCGNSPLSSCEGHGNKLGFIERVLLSISNNPFPRFKPFVMFTCSLNFAKTMSDKLNSNIGLNYSWEISGHFNPIIKELTWVIQPNDYRLEQGDICLNKVSLDIKKLAFIVEDIKQ